MTGRVVWVADQRAPGTPDRLHGERHESRALAARVAEGDEDAAAALRGVYARQAVEWADWVATQPEYLAPVAAALRNVGRVRVAFEVGAGSGQASALLAAHADVVVVSDASFEMLERADRAFPEVVADVRRLPLRDASADLVLGVNAPLDAREVARVVAPDGVVVWASSFGDDTPLYVSPEDLVERLGDGWRGVAGRAGHGDWCVARRMR